MPDGKARKGASTAVLATSLYRQLAAEPGNLFFSPYSIAAALSMCLAGAEGATREEIEAALSLADTDVVETFGELRNVLAGRARPAPRPFELSVASALWLQSGYPLRPEFLETLRDRLGAEVKETDFSGARARAVREVNAWVDKATRGKIREILSESQIDALTRMILATAIYFKASWLSPFEEELTRPEPFHLLDGRNVDVPMMHDTTHRRYARSRGFQVLEVPYGNDWVVMVLVLPDEGKFGSVERELDVGRAVEMIRGASAVRVALALPRFRIESSFALRAPLGHIGIIEGFSPRADFTRVSAEPGFHLGEVLHRAVVDVDEQGTEAAAITAVLTLGAALNPRPPPRPIEFRVDRPFLFLIVDKPTGTILFQGRVVDPGT